jgi:hypothetical protein
MFYVFQEVISQGRVGFTRGINLSNPGGWLVDIFAEEKGLSQIDMRKTSLPLSRVFYVAMPTLQQIDRSPSSHGLARSFDFDLNARRSSVRAGKWN